MKLALLTTVALGVTLGACTPEVPEQEAPPGLTNGSFTATLNGFQIHYEVRGRGPVLMTVPNSWGLSLQGLRAMYEPLEERLTLVYFDPRGMGGSEAVREDSDRGMAAVRADFQALRAHLGLATVNAIGWSNGGGNLIFLAHEQPESLSAAIFVHQGASFTPEDAKRVGVYGGSYGGFMTLMALFRQPDLFACGAALRPVTENDYILLSDVGFSRSLANIVGEGEWAVALNMPESGLE